MAAAGGGFVDATGVVVKDRFRAFLSNFVEAAPAGGADASFASQSQQSQAHKVRVAHARVRVRERKATAQHDGAHCARCCPDA